MIEPLYIKGKMPLFFDGKEIYYSKGNAIFKSSFPFKTKEPIGTFNAGYIHNLLAKSSLISRIARLGFHGLKPFRDGLLGIQRGKIVFKQKNSTEFKEVFSGFRGSRPLNLYVDPSQTWACFGEYFGNDEREEVKIFSTSTGYDWKESYRFKGGEIRHVHGLIEDSYKKGIWCLTGDSDTESALWFTTDRFKTLEKVASGSQKARAVEIIPVEGGLLVPMDSPLQKNYINFYDRETKDFRNLESLPGSAFHAIKSNGIYFVTTVTEPSEINITDKATVYASLDGFNWKYLYEFQRDVFPVKYQGITRYTEVTIPEGENNSDYIFGYARAVKEGDAMVVWRKEDVIQFLGNDF